MTDLTDAPTLPDAVQPHRDELWREAFTMAFYVAICVLAALTAVVERDAEAHTSGLLLIWGTTIGLALAHWLAFRLASRLVTGGAWRRHDVEIVGAQLAGAAVVALLASVPILLLPGDIRFAAARLILAVFVAAAAYAVGRASGAGVARAAAFGIGVAAVAGVIAVVKNVLAGH